MEVGKVGRAAYSQPRRGAGLRQRVRVHRDHQPWKGTGPVPGPQRPPLGSPTTMRDPEPNPSEGTKVAIRTYGIRW